MIEFLVKHALLGLLVGAVGTGVVLLLTSKRSLVRTWLLASPDRILAMGFGAMVLLWIGVAAFNRFDP